MIALIPPVTVQPLARMETDRRRRKGKLRPFDVSGEIACVPLGSETFLASYGCVRTLFSRIGADRLAECPDPNARMKLVGSTTP